LTGIFAQVTYFCQQTGPVLPAFTFTAAVASDMEMGPNLVVSAMTVIMHAYNLGNGSSVGRCRLPVSKPELKAIETKM